MVRKEQPTLLLMAGLPGSGKTTLALALGYEMRWPVLDKDTLKSTLLEMGIEERVAGPTSYDLLFAIGYDLLVQQGHSIILDSPSLYPLNIERAERIAREANARLKVILCVVEEHVRRARLMQRRRKISQPLIHAFPVSEQERDRFGHLPAETLVLHTAQPLEVLVPTARAFLLELL